MDGGPSQAGALAQRAVGLLVLVAIAAGFVEAAETTVAREIMPYAAVALVTPLLPMVLERRPDPFSPAILTGSYASVGLSAVLVHLLGTSQLNYREINLSGARATEKAIEAFVLLTIASISYLAGYYVFRRGIGVRWLPNVRGFIWNQSRLLSVSIVLGVVFLGCYAFFQSRIGTGLLEFTLAEGKAVWRDDPTLSWMMRGIGLGQIPILLYGAYVVRPTSRRKAMLLGAFALVMVFFTMRTGGRAFALSLLIGLGVIFHYQYRRIPTWVVAIAIVFALIGSNALGQIRTGVPTVEGPPNPLKASEVLTQHEDDRQRLLPMVTIMHFFPEKRDLLLGETWAGIVAAPVPRWLWPGKVDAFRMRDTQIIMELAGSPTPCPLQFLLYANFGWPGVVAGMSLWGAFHRGLARWREESRGDRGTTLLYAMILLHVGPTLLQISATMQWVLPCWLAILFIGRRRSTAPVGLVARQNPEAQST